MEDAVVFLLKKFPPYCREILDSFAHDEDFKSLCEDYYSVSLLFKSYRQKIIRDHKVEREYKELFLELEMELQEFLQKK